MWGPRGSGTVVLRMALRMTSLARFALRQDLLGVLIQSSRLGHRVDGLLQLRIVLQFYLVAVVQAEIRREYLALDLPLQPRQVGLDILLGVLDLLLVQILAQFLEQLICHRGIFGPVTL